MPLSVDLNTSQDLLVTISPVDDRGEPSAIEAGTLTGLSLTPAVIADGTLVDPATYGITDAGTEALLCVTTGATGTFEVQVSGDADVGAGVQTISDLVTGTVSHAFAKSLGLGARGVAKVA